MRRTLSAVCIVLIALSSGSAWSDDNDAHWVKDSKGCLIWDDSPKDGRTVIWSGSCQNGYAEGVGVARWSKSGNTLAVAGRLLKGKTDGIIRYCGVPTGKDK